MAGSHVVSGLIYMVIEILLRLEDELTAEARVQLGVVHHVALHVGLLVEPLTAHGAHVRTLPGVCQHVTAEVARAKMLPAFWALDKVILPRWGYINAGSFSLSSPVDYGAFRMCTS